MKHQVCSVFDQALVAYARPFFAPTTAAAVRSFADEVNRKAPDNPLSAHPEDYALFWIATFDDESGRFETYEPAERLVTAVNVRKE